jgi:KRAB domain-containing zinc finger protein
MDRIKTEPDSDSDLEPVSALCETELMDVKEDSASANGLSSITAEDFRAQRVNGMKGQGRHRRTDVQHKDHRQMETPYVKQEPGGKITMLGHGTVSEDMRGSSSAYFANHISDDEALPSGNSMSHAIKQTGESVETDSTEVHGESNCVTGVNCTGSVTLSFISTDEQDLVRRFGDLSHICYVCNKGFGNRVNLRRHYRVHTEYERYDCKDCDKSYRHLIDLKRHALIHTGEQPYSCDVCSKSFSRITHLRDHTLTHTGERPHVCKICSKSFSQASNLQTHQLTHTGERPHVCPVCGKCFSQRANLQTHSVLHSGLRPYVCKLCGKGFHRRRDLQNHCVMHTGERPHVCQVCNKTFALLDNLRKHSELHSGKRPHECKQCDKTFTKKNDLNRHMRQHMEDLKQDK